MLIFRFFWYNTPMRKIQIILGILIVLGLGALATQKLWVPKLVDYIISKDNQNLESENPEVESENQEVKLVGKNCYAYDQLATKEAPYEVHETLVLNIEGEKVTGTKNGNQKGPDLTNGYFGNISGEIKEDKIESIFSYTVEGSEGKESEIYEIKSDKLIKLRYPLNDEKGVLVPDTTFVANSLIYNKIDCTSIPLE